MYRLWNRGVCPIFAIAVILGSTGCAHTPQTSYAYAEFNVSSITSGTKGNVEPGNRFQLGSLAKYACTIAALRLADRETLSLDGEVRHLLPELESDGFGRVTLRQLLSNRSGLADGLMPAISADMASVTSVKTTAEAVRLYVPSELAFEPGTRFSYDLVNWILVQAIIERAHGASLESALAELVFEPAALETMAVLNSTGEYELQTPATPANPIPSFLQCAGGLAGMPSDLIGLQRFVHGGGLSPQSWAALQTITTPEEEYTIGGRFRTVEGRLLDWQTGSNGAYKSLSVYDPHRKIGFAATTSQDDWTAIEQARDEWLRKTQANSR